MRIICSTVFTLPLIPAAMTMPRSAAISRSAATTNSRATKMMHASTESSRIHVKRMNAVCVRILSAMGSMNLPKLVTRPRRLAICPSKRSVRLAAAKTSSAIHRKSTQKLTGLIKVEIHISTR